MRVALVCIVIVAIIAAIMLTWLIISYRRNITTRRSERFIRLSAILNDVDRLLYAYSPADALGASLEMNVREVFVAYGLAQIDARTDKRRLQNAEAACSRLSVLFNRHPQSLFRPGDDASKTFVREAFSVLHPATSKEIPHVP